MNLASGDGYGFNPGHTGDGVTGPLAVMPGVLAQWVGIDAVAAAKVFGLFCAALAAALVVQRAYEASGAMLGWFTCCLVALTPTLGIWGQAGLETGGATLCFSVAVLAASREPVTNVKLLGLCAAAIAWLRPELLPATWVLIAWTITRVTKRERIVLVSLCAIGVIGIVVFRLAMFGTLVPLSFFAKPGELGAGAGYTLRALVVHTTLAGAILAAYSTKRALQSVLVVHLLAVALAGGDWMPGYRLFAPVIPLYAWLAADGALELFRKQRRVLAPMLFGLALVLPVLDIVVELPLAREAGHSRDRVGHEVASYLRSHAHRVALVDVGYLVYRSNLTVVDLGGVTDAAMGRARGPYLDKRISEAELRAREPDTIVLHSQTPFEIDGDGRVRNMRGYGVEQRVGRMRWVHDNFRVARVFRYAPNYHYAVLFLDGINAH